MAVYNRDQATPETLVNEAELETPSLGTTTASVVSLDPLPRKAVVGAWAKRNQPADPVNTVIEIKREMGEMFTKDTLAKYHGDRGGFSEGEPVRAEFAGQWLLPQEISAFILMRMKQVAEQEIGEEIRDAVITVPAYFDAQKRAATREAALLAGLYPRQILPEPTAAAIAYGLDQFESEKKCYLVYDLGGGTFDVSIIEVEGQKVGVISTSGDKRLGGGDFDDAIAAWTTDQLGRQFHFDLNRLISERAMRFRADLKLKAEQAKIILSSVPETNLIFPELMMELHLPTPPIVNLTRDKFEELVGEYLRRSLNYVDEAIKFAAAKSVTRDDITAIILVGGSSKIPRVKTLLLEYFEKGDDFVRAEADPDQIVARGAAIEAFRYQPSPPPFDPRRPMDNESLMNAEAAGIANVFHITEHTLGVGVQGGRVAHIIAQGTNIPTEHTEDIFVNGGPTDTIPVYVFQGESQFQAECSPIGIVPITDLEPLPEGKHRFAVTFKLDMSGLLTASVRQVSTGQLWSASFQHKAGVGGLDAIATLRERLLGMFAGTPSTGFIPPPVPVEPQADMPPWPPYQPGGVPGVPPPPPPPGGVPVAGMQPPWGQQPPAGAGMPPPPMSTPPTPAGAPQASPMPSGGLPVVGGIALVALVSDPGPDEAQLVRRAHKLLIRFPDTRLARACNEYVNAFNQGVTGDDLSDLLADLKDAFKYAHQQGVPPMGTQPISPEPRRSDDNVQFTVFRPQVVAPQKWYPLLAFAHLSERRSDAPPDEPDPVQEVQRQAMQALGEQLQDYRPVTHDSIESVPKEGELTFVPEVPGIEFNPPRATFLWLESVHRQDFRLRAASELDGETARGRLTVFLGRRILADVALAIRVNTEADRRHGSMATEAVSARPYRKVFASYSHKDGAVVDEFEQIVTAFGDQYLRDSLTLRAGEIWSDRLAEMIREADIFQLFWSSNSMGSSFVRQEWEHALSLNRQNFVRPVYWEEPFPENTASGLPPEALRRLHFQSLRLSDRARGYPLAPEHIPFPRVPPDAESIQERELQELKSRHGPSDFTFSAGGQWLDSQEIELRARWLDKRSYSTLMLTGGEFLLEDELSGLVSKGLDINVGSGKKEEFDFQGEVARMLDAANQGREEKGGTGIKIDDIGFDVEFLSADGLVDPIEKLLRQAQQHIHENEYDLALIVLNQLLAEAPSHHEAIYLKAYCQAHSEEGEDAATLALRTLRPLRDAALNSTLAVRVETLSDTLRARRFVPFLIQFLLYKEDTGQLIRFLRQEVEIDPSSSLPHYLLAGELMVTGQLDEAIAVVDNGLRRVREDERERLLQVRAAAGERLAERALQPALDYYRHGKFAQALGVLAKVSPLHRQTRLCVMFEAYLGELSGGATGFWSGLFNKPRQPVDVRPSGSPADLDTLGFFIVRKDLEHTRARMENPSVKGTIEAEKCALSAIAHAPWFPFIHFIGGQCIYARLGEALKADHPPSVEEFERALHAARKHLEFAANDPEITDAPIALQAIDEVLAQAAQARKIQEARAAEFKELGAAIQEFKAIMDLVGDGVRDAAHYRQIHQRLEALKARLPKLRRLTKSDEGKEALTNLTEAVNGNLAQLEKLKGKVEDGEKLEKHFSAFKNKMEWLERNRISNYSELADAKRFFNQLLAAAKSDRAHLNSSEARTAIDNLISQLNSVLSMLNRN